jgi:precorrin-6Y C5,15-methyltransferase (decarboxylating)
VNEEAMKTVPVPDKVMLVASASMEQELDLLTRLNPNLNIVIYTLDMGVAANIDKVFEPLGIRDKEVIQIAVSKLGHKNLFTQEPAPWIITARAERK